MIKKKSEPKASPKILPVQSACELIHRGLQDDDWEWDWTARAAEGASRARTTLTAHLICKSGGVFAGEAICLAVQKVAEQVQHSKASGVSVSSPVSDGTILKAGQKVATLKGGASLLLALERPLINLLAYTSGVATQTRSLVELLPIELRGKIRITSTRKTLPGYRDLGVYGVLCGGGFAHRTSLSGGVLIKENHIEASGGIVHAIEAARRIAPHGLKIEIEVTNQKELEQAFLAGAEVVMLDNFSPTQVAQSLAWLAPRRQQGFTVEVSGGINAQNIRDYAQLGVNVISVGGLTHSVKAVDYSLLVAKK